MNLFYYVDGPCGSSKTYAATRYAHRFAGLGNKVLFVQPSIHLINQTIKDITTFKPEVRVRAINGETSTQVIADIVDHAKHTSPGGEILFITHAALMLLPYLHRKGDWHLIVDEIPQADWCEEFSIPKTHRLITDCISADPEAESLADNRYVRIVPQDRQALEEIARNKPDDQIWGIFQKLANVLLSPHWSAYVLDDQYTNLINSSGKRRQLLTFAHLKPTLFEGYASVTIMGACFRHSILYQLWSTMGVEFRAHGAITKQLRYQRHENGDVLTIRYAIDEDWSKTFRDKAVGDQRSITVGVRVVERVREVFVDADFVWMGNKDLADETFAGHGHRLPNSPFGLNPYEHIHNAAILSALNPTPAHFTFLDALGFNSNEVRQAGYWQAVYQAALRTSLRNPYDRNPKTVAVMDRATAEWMAAMFPGCTIAPLGGIGEMPAKGTPGRPRLHENDVERKRANRDKFKLELQAALDLINGGDRVVGQFPELAAELRRRMSEFGCEVDQHPTKIDDGNLRSLGGTIFATVRSSAPLDYFPLDDIKAFVDGLRFFHAFANPSKEMNGLISPGIFDPYMGDETKRGLANVRAIWGVWLDNDGGDLSVEEFGRLFPRLRMVIFNSYSSTREKPRWRVFIPTTVAMPIAAYNAITGQIMVTLNSAGYWSKTQLEKNGRIKSRKLHGFDMSKLTPSSLFYLPCQAANPESSFFIDLHGRSRTPLDPYLWAGYAANHVPGPEPEMIAEPDLADPSLLPVAEPTCPKLGLLRERLRDEQKAETDQQRYGNQQSAITRWQSALPGTGNHAFFQLGVDLRKAGLTLANIEMVLRQQAAYAHHPRDRQNQIKSVIKTLRNWRYR